MSLTMSTTTTMDMASATSSAVSMSTSSSSMTMSASTMAMVFFTGSTTPLYSSSWVPATTGQYAGTCIFLVALAVAHRLLTAARALLFTHAAPGAGIERINSEDGQIFGKESLVARARNTWRDHPFRVATEAWRAGLEVVIGGVSYLLMLAVMTMNLGYFLSVLGGIFLGAFVAGRFGPGGH